MQYFIAGKITEMEKKNWANEQNTFFAVVLQCIWKQQATNMHNQYNLLHDMRIYYRESYYSLLKIERFPKK